MANSILASFFVRPVMKSSMININYVQINVIILGPGSPVNGFEGPHKLFGKFR